MEKNVRVSRRGHRQGVVFFAFVLIAIGVVLLCANIGLIPMAYKHALVSWPMLLIVFGIVKLFKGKLGTSLILLFIGVFFLLPRINKVDPNFFSFIPANFIELYWPVFLIVIGAFLLLRWMFPSSRIIGSCRKKRCSTEGFSPKETISGGCVDINNLFSGSEQIVLDEEFKGGEINSVFGGTKLDLRKTKLPEGETTLEVNLVFGGVEMYVPLDWNVDIRVDAIMGAFEDKRYGVQRSDSSRKLIIKGSCVFAGGELKN